MVNIRRNQLCFCNSGKKYKHCHGSLSNGDGEPDLDHKKLERFLREFEETERARQLQQGLGKKIVGLNLGDSQMVFVGNRLYQGASWGTFTDFLFYYIKHALGPDWFDEEIQKPPSRQHQIVKWYITLRQQLSADVQDAGSVVSSSVTGLVVCYVGLAYSLYLLDHNVELQSRLIRHLKDRSNFQGAYYELIVANILIRAGFDLTLEDETDPRSRHCEFSAMSRKTRKRYSVEAKMRSVRGLNGKTELDGGKDGQHLAKLGNHIRRALEKPSVGVRLIFVDVNRPQRMDQDGRPVWLKRALRSIDQIEREDLPDGKSAYVFVTNFAFHRELDKEPTLAIAALGLGMPDFPRPGSVLTEREVMKAKTQHIDVFDILDASSRYIYFPPTFDGSDPSELFK